MITANIKFEDAEVKHMLVELQAKIGNLRPVMKDIGELITEKTKNRFLTSTGPDGKPWKRNTQATYLAYLGKQKKLFNKKGKLMAIDKKPLVGVTKQLGRSIDYDAGKNSVIIGTDKVYAAAQQFGIKKGESGKTKRGTPIPWGDIPARPFMGVSDDDMKILKKRLGNYLVE